MANAGLDMGNEVINLFAYTLGCFRVLRFECGYVHHHLFKFSSRDGIQLL